jgi:hypothetical protein
MKKKQLSALIDTDDPQAVWGEVHHILGLLPLEVDLAMIKTAFETAVSLYQGTYEGYRACNTGYHTLDHATSTLLTMAQLLHGAWDETGYLTPADVQLGLIAAMYHDAGYIQEADDTCGTGAKHTARHVERSMDLLEKLARRHNLLGKDIGTARVMINYTDITIDIDELNVTDERTDFLGRMLTAADLLAQLADRHYLEKLPHLYEEFREGRVGNYTSKIDLIRSTLGFIAFCEKYLDRIFPDCHRYLVRHFTLRWQTEENLYRAAIDGHRDYLKKILNLPEKELLAHLKRREKKAFERHG